MITEVVLAATGLLMIVGGIIGFKKAGSKASLIGGSACAILIFGSLALAFLVNLSVGFGAAFVALIVPEVIMGKRFAATKKFMPAGMILAISIVAHVLVIVSFCLLARS